MTKLHLGVVDIPYGHNARGGQPRRGGRVTTGDVAEWLEDKYDVMQHFFDLHSADIAKDLEGSLQGTLENLLLGAPSGIDPFASAGTRIKDRFSQFLTMREMDSLGVPGVPTQAAIDRASGKRRSSRFKKKKGRAVSDQATSFINTGLYESSFSAWVSDD